MKHADVHEVFKALTSFDMTNLPDDAQKAIEFAANKVAEAMYQNPVRYDRFDHGGINYLAESQLVDTDYGPENRVDIYQAAQTMQEAAGTDTIIGWFKDAIDNPDSGCDICAETAVVSDRRSGLTLCTECGQKLITT